MTAINEISATTATDARLKLKALADGYHARGYFTGMTAQQIRDEIDSLNRDTKDADKRTYNGKMTRTYNNAIIAIAEIILGSMDD
jgi:hypothetical protein